MKTISERKGFTLVELLVVISIISILAGIFLNRIGDFRDRAEDARRIADLRHVQTVLELYYNKCNSYPNGNSLTDGTCPDSVSPVTWTTEGDWEKLENILKGAGIKVKALPKDPDSPRSTYQYGSDGDGYVIKAILNTDNPVLKDSSRGTIYGINCGSASDDPKTTSYRTYCVEF